MHKPATSARPDHSLPWLAVTAAKLVPSQVAVIRCHAGSRSRTGLQSDCLCVQVVFLPGVQACRQCGVEYIISGPSDIGFPWPHRDASSTPSIVRRHGGRSAQRRPLQGETSGRTPLCRLVMPQESDPNVAGILAEALLREDGSANGLQVLWLPTGFGHCFSFARCRAGVHLPALNTSYITMWRPLTPIVACLAALSSLVGAFVGPRCLVSSAS